MIKWLNNFFRRLSRLTDDDGHTVDVLVVRESDFCSCERCRSSLVAPSLPDITHLKRDLVAKAWSAGVVMFIDGNRKTHIIKNRFGDIGEVVPKE